MTRYCKLENNDKIYAIKQISENNVIIEDNNIKIKTTLDKVIILPDDFIPTKRNINTTVHIVSNNISNEIMLRHKLKEEAISELDKYIDQAVVEKLGRVRIIHGKHGGVLRNAVHEYLKTHPFVKEFYIADYSEGGIGVTIAILGKKPQL